MSVLVQDDRGEAIKVAEAVQHFITAMDAVKLEQRANDELQPLISDVMTGCVGGLLCVAVPEASDSGRVLTSDGWVGGCGLLQADARARPASRLPGHQEDAGVVRRQLHRQTDGCAGHP